MEAILLILVFAVFWSWTRTPYADEPVKLHDPDMEPSAGYKAAISIPLLGVLLIALAGMVGGGSLDTATVADVRNAGGADAVTALGGAALLGSIGLLLMIHGIATKLALLIFLAGVVLSMLVVGSATP